MRDEWKWGAVLAASALVVSLASSIEFGVWLVLFAVLAWWTWFNSTLAVSLFIIMAPILPMLKITQTLGSITLVKDVIILTLFMRWFVWPLAVKQLPYRRNSLILPIVVLGVWVLAGVTRADSTVLGLLRARDILLYPLLFLGILYMPHSYKAWKEWGKWFIAGLGILAVLAGYQWWVVPGSTVLRYDPIGADWIPRVSSIMAHPSIFGEYLVIGLSLAAGMILTVKKWRNRIWWSGAGAGLLGLIFLTYSRAVWIGAVAALGVMGLVYTRRRMMGSGAAWSGRKLKKILLMGGGLVIVVIIGLSQTSAGVYIKTIVDPTYGSNEERLEFMARLIAPLTNQEAIFGRGLGDVLEQNFRKTSINTADIAEGAAREVQLAKNATLVDNQYLKTLVELGLAGLLIMGWIYIAMLRQAQHVIFNPLIQRTSFQSANTADRLANLKQTVGYWGLGVLAAFVLQGFFIDIWEIFPTNAYFWIAAALVSAAGTPGIWNKE